MINGIDISYANKNLDYKAIKNSGVEFAIIRTGYSQKTDDMFYKHIEGALNAGLKVGAYVYCMSTDVNKAMHEADYAARLLKEYNITYPVFLDFEDERIGHVGRKGLTDIAEAFIRVIRNYGYIPGVYANPSWFNWYLQADRLISRCEIWLAHWTNNPNSKTKYNFGQSIWQWGLDNSIGLDGDISYVDYSKISYNDLYGDEYTKVASDVCNGVWSNGNVRKERLKAAGWDVDEVQRRVNELLYGVQINENERIADEVIQGKWGNGKERIAKLTEAGYDYLEIQNIVNGKLKK